MVNDKNETRSSQPHVCWSHGLMASRWWPARTETVIIVTVSLATARFSWNLALSNVTRCSRHISYRYVCPCNTSSTMVLLVDGICDLDLRKKVTTTWLLFGFPVPVCQHNIGLVCVCVCVCETTPGQAVLKCPQYQSLHCITFAKQSLSCCEEHVKFILSLCSQRVYLLKLLRDRGLSASQLQLVCQANIISRLAYTLPAWDGFLSADNRNRLDGFLRRLYKCGFTVCLFTIEQLLCDADIVLFRKVLIDGHCLHHLLPPLKTLSIQLRPASHNCQLHICKYMLYKRSFLVRCLFNCH